MNRPRPKQVVLIADADSENAVVLQAMLAPEYDIKFAVDRIAAVRLASPPDQPALILLSDLLPAADALGVLKDLKTGDFTG
jgi:CheY-like chemotaxis protein